MSVRAKLAVACAAAWVGAGIAIVGAGAGCSISIPGWQQAAFEEARESWAPVAGVQAVTVESANGAIVVRPGAEGEEQVKIVAEVRATSAERLALTEVRADEQADGSLRVWVQWPEGGRLGNEGARLEIELPAGSASSLKADTSNGPIEVTGLSLAQGAQLTSSNGAITVREVAGDVRAVTSNGAVIVEGATGDVEAHSSNGRIEVAQAPGAGSGAGSVVAETSNGGIRIELAAGFAGEISGRTSNGSVRLPRGEDVAVLRSERRDSAVRVGDGGGESRVEAKTSNGTIDVRR